jgi:uncharacterized lipoprotein YmbA
MRWMALILLLLAGCGSLPQPFSKAQPLPARDPLVAPPWEALVKAGPNASKEIDLETLNGPVRAPQSVATADPPPPEPEAQPEEPDNRTVIDSVAVLAVEGDTSKGNQELTKAMREALSDAGWTVRNAAAKSALTIKGKVDVGQPAGSTQSVKLTWVVAKPDGKALGTISQANTVPAGSLAQGWGENARAAVEGAATGIFELINKYR